MKNNIEPYFSSLVLESILRDSNLTFLERLLLIQIISLCKSKGYCWATNKYFSNIYGVTTVTISKSISNLATHNYIETKYENKNMNNSKRKIRLSTVLNKKLNSIKNNINTSVKENFKQYNKKKENNNIYYQDEFGNEYWHGKLIKNEEATIEEQEELKRLLEEFKDYKEE